MENIKRLLVVGNPATFHVGAHFVRGAQTLGLEVTLVDVNRAYANSAWVRRWDWHIRQRRPTYLEQFGKIVLQASRLFQPDLVLVIGIAPVNKLTVQSLLADGIKCINFVTDDPWSVNHRAEWYLETLPFYTTIFTPRQSNVQDFTDLNCKSVSYLPFAYDPTLHSPVMGQSLNMNSYDVLYVGGGDKDRLPFAHALINAELQVALVGSYWNKYPSTQPYALGIVSGEQASALTYCAKVNICLVRRANRDGHVMRSFEIPACNGGMVVEDTAEHRAIFGPEYESVLYFDSPQTMLEKVRWLLHHPRERETLKSTLYQRITIGNHTYSDRLKLIITAITKGVAL